MGMITIGITVENALDRDKRVEAEALVDTGATYLTLPTAWRDRFGAFEKEQSIQLESADQKTYEGTLCAPVRIEIGDFEPVYTEALFIDMKDNNGANEPLLGVIPLETGRLAVDLDSHMLVSLKRAKLK